MNRNELKDIVPNEDVERIVSAFVGIVLFIIFLVISLAILPENCYLYEYRQIGFLCDGISEISQLCPDCKDERMVSVAQIAFVFGIACFFLPFVISQMRKLRSNPVKELKLFD